MILNEGQPEAWRVHTTSDASPTLYAERPPAILQGIKKEKYDLLFPLDFACTLCARDGIKTGPHSPNGEDAYDRKLVAMRKKRFSEKKVEHYYYHHKCSCDIREVLVCPCMGAERNTNASNDNPLVVTCYSSPQARSRENPIVLNFMGSKGNNVITQDGTCPTLTRMHGNDVHVICSSIEKMKRHTYNRPRNEMFVEDDVAQCLGASHNMSPLNNRIIVAECIRRGFGKTNKPPVVYGLDQQGGKGGANYTENIAPTICSDSHGTPHGVCVPMHGSKKGV